MAILDQKVALIPTQSGDVEIPAYEIQWWDIQNQRMQVTRLPAKTIQVLPGDVSAPPSTPTPQPVVVQPLAPTQSAPTATTPGTKATPQVASTNTSGTSLGLKDNIWFWSSLGLLLAWLATLHISRPHRRRGGQHRSRET